MCAGQFVLLNFKNSEGKINQLNKMETPRRNRLDLNTPAEKAIYNAMQEIEKAGADVRLTEAVILLSKAREMVADFIDNIEVIKDKYSYIKESNREHCTIYKNNLYFGAVGSESEAKYLCYALENFDDLEFAASPTNLVLYLDGRCLGELKVNQMLAEKVTTKMATVFKIKPKVKGVDMSDIGWEYDNH